MALRFKKGTEFREAVDLLAELGGSPEPTYAVTKSRPEDRYTFGPLYSPDVDDAHGEFATAEDLQKAIWDYTDFEKDTFHFQLRKQHGDEVIGRICEIVQWPFEVETELSVAGKMEKHALPAGTVYAGVLWSEDSWPDVKSGKITGLSMGGRAVRIAEPSVGAFT